MGDEIVAELLLCFCSVFCLVVLFCFVLCRQINKGTKSGLVFSDKFISFL